MNRVVHFEMSADDPERASNFYRNVFGWKIDEWEGPVDYWLVTTGAQEEPGIDGGIKKQPEFDTGTVNAIDVSSIDEFVEKIESHGGELVMPKTEIPGVVITLTAKIRKVISLV